MPKKLTGLSAAVLGGDLYTIGGFDGNYGNYGNGGVYQTAIHRLSCSSRVCTWTTMNQHLKVARGALIAIPVMDSVCTPTTPTTTMNTAITNTTTTTVTTTTTTTTSTTTTTTTTTTTATTTTTTISTTSTTTTTANVISSK